MLSEASFGNLLMEINLLQFISNNFEWVITSLVLIAVNFGMIKQQLKEKVNKSEVSEMIEDSVFEHFNNCPKIHNSFSNVKGAILQTKVEKIENTCDIIQADIKEILVRLPK